jgi:hypothetical protein
MADYTINAEDVTTAAQLLRDVLTTKNPDNDYTEGSVLGDTIVDGHATAFALLRKQLADIKNRLSLRDISKLGDSESVTDAADAILSNFYRSRDQGRFAKGAASLHFSQRVDVLIPRRTRFFRTPQLVFYLEGTADLFIPSTTMRPNIDATGRVVDYVVPVNLTAARVGSLYNQQAGRFVAVDPFSPFLTYAENLSPFVYGDDLQSTSAFIATSQNAFSLRALVNARSNDALLRGELFPEIQELLTVNYGDPEMQRDLATDPASGVRLHVGGHSDIYVKLQTQEIVERLIINESAARPDNLITILRDTLLPSGSFIASGVVIGDILVIESGTPNAPFQYSIRAVRETEIEVSARVPFEIATDEETAPAALTYHIGNNYPAYDNKVTRTASTARTSRRLKEYNRVMLPGRPTYRVKQAELINAPSLYDPYRDIVTGTVIFSERQNAPITGVPVPGSALGYYMSCKNPEAGQSNNAVTMLEVGWPAADLTGLTLEVTYTTVVGFDPIANYVNDDFNRTTGANPLVRAHHPVYLKFSIPYRVRTIIRNSLDVFSSVGGYTVSESTVLSSLVNYILAVPFGVRPDTGTLSSVARVADANIVATYPFSITYTLLAPDGKMYEYATDDIATLFPDGGATSSARLTNPAEVGLPLTGYEAALKQQLLRLGVSDRTVRYIATTDDLALEQRGI